ncbi:MULTISPECIES: spore germination protein [Heyndrickxia]|jgi:spore germination protein PA|uniref:Spore germination protein n=1 Tax=Heyndrickxia oleronia TaxID=38875 RepID=A0A8E2IDH5_9BACI|nr:spore germination protein [Heyndrickxia oleronia]NYV67723.1 spore germination protein [Bacillus sp. Gen3]OJH17616.1 spore gernimation protein GerPA [Bacillus obstructivus]MBU5211807.1 spore germination protein [Heyndrickxia oleronia]MCI1592953.1 spore germination protein [Heyndrickxia oleronia]MCI1615689.1 spore germination protein [Heyndrickxia oleronia]
MPGFVGAVQIMNIGSSGVFHIGDVFQLTPISTAKTFAGAGSFNTGETLTIRNHQSATNTFDNDGIDQGNNFNL